MKVIFDFDMNKISSRFAPADPEGMQNFMDFLRDGLVDHFLEKKTEDMDRHDAILRRYRRLNEDGNAVFDAIMEVHEAKIALGKLLMESLKIEM